MVQAVCVWTKRECPSERVDKPLIFASAKINRLPTLIHPLTTLRRVTGNGDVECLRRNNDNFLIKKTVEKGAKTD